MFANIYAEQKMSDEFTGAHMKGWRNQIQRKEGFQLVGDTPYST